MIARFDIGVVEIQQMAAIKPDAEGYPVTSRMVYSASADGYSVMICVSQDARLSVIIETEPDFKTTGTPYLETSADEVDDRPMTLIDLNQAAAGLTGE